MLISRTVTLPVITQGVVPPVTLGGLKDVARILQRDNSEDDFLEACLEAAVDQAEGITNKFLSRKLVSDVYYGFENFVLFKGPYTEGSLGAITYQDEDETEKQLVRGQDYYVDISSSSAAVCKPLKDWPSYGKNISFTYSSGYVTAPKGLVMAVYRLAAYFDVSRNLAPGDLPAHLEGMFSQYSSKQI